MSIANIHLMSKEEAKIALEIDTGKIDTGKPVEAEEEPKKKEKSTDNLIVDKEDKQ